MKTTLVLIAALLAGVSFVELRAQNSASGANAAAAKVALPYGQECIITVDPRAERSIQVTNQSTPSGFQSDGTLRGQLLYMSEEWCVLKDGTFENWVPREKILTMRVSK